MTIRIIDGDLLQATENIIGHQVNARGAFASSIAGQIRKKWVVAYESYTQYCYNKNPQSVMGKFDLVKVEEDKYIAHLFGQLNYGSENVVYTDYVRLEEALIKIKNVAKESGLTVALPWMIGCGLANGDWATVWKIIDEVFQDYEVTLYKYNG